MPCLIKRICIPDIYLFNLTYYEASFITYPPVSLLYKLLWY